MTNGYGEIIVAFCFTVRLKRLQVSGQHYMYLRLLSQCRGMDIATVRMICLLITASITSNHWLNKASNDIPELLGRFSHGKMA
jgi:hypothetical protein